MATSNANWNKSAFVNNADTQFDLSECHVQAANGLSTRRLRSSFSYRTSSVPNRLNQLCATSTIQRFAFFAGVRLGSAASCPVSLT